MNITMIAVCLLAYRMLKGNSTSNNTTQRDTSSMIDSMLSDDAKSILGSIDSLTASGGDRTGALLSLLTNPSVMAVVSGMFGGLLDNLVNLGNNRGEDANRQTDQPTGADSSTDVQDDRDNSQYDTSPYYHGSANAKQFFTRVDDIAGQEVSSKLYHIYDNWYTSAT